MKNKILNEFEDFIVKLMVERMVTEAQIRKQLEKEYDLKLFELKEWLVEKASKWLEQNK